MIASLASSVEPALGQTTEKPDGDGHSLFELQPNLILLRILIATLLLLLLLLLLLAEVALEFHGPDSRLFRNPYNKTYKEEEELLV